MKTQKFILTAVIFLLSTLCASAYDFEVNGLYYNFISGTDNVEVTYSDEYPNPYNGDIVIPGTVSWEGKVYQVTEIGDGAFHSAEITSCQIPNSITKIGSWAFTWTDLADITIPASVTTIGEYVFWGTEKMTAINVKNSNLSFSSSAGILFDKEKSTLINHIAKIQIIFFLQIWNCTPGL